MVLSILSRGFMNIGSFIDRLLPDQPCVLCGCMSREGLWCSTCDNSLPYLDRPSCPVCALPTTAGEICGHCLSHPPVFTRTTAVFSYMFPVDKLVHGMKYGGQLALASAFATRLAGKINPDALPDCVIPMPLHPSKLRERGFNQSLLLAAKISRMHKLKLLTDACTRVRDTPPQSVLPWKERKKNVRDAFECDIDLTGKKVALVDDVMTTGASLDALASAIRKCGAIEISSWVVARTLPHA